MPLDNFFRQHILANLDDKCRIKASASKFMGEVLDTLSEDALKNWPFDFADEGYSTTYLKIEKNTVRRDIGFNSEALSLTMEVSNQDESFQMMRTMYLDDDQIFIHLDNIHRTKGSGMTNFAYTMVKKLKAFIEAQDKKRNDRSRFPSEIRLEATSNNDKSGIANVGGYVWALQGFDFASLEELLYLRKHFQSFARKHGVEIEDKDLRYFTKPAHFASFHNGKYIEDKFGQPAHLGKAFLLIHEEWQGRMVSFSGNNEEQRFADAYNRRPRKPEYRLKAFKTLNSRYKNMVRKYYEHHQAERIKGLQMPLIEKYYQLIRSRFSSLGKF